MNECLINNWNNIVKPEDTVYYLGDFSLNHKLVERVMPRLMGQVHLIPGNHDECHPVCRRKKSFTIDDALEYYLHWGFKSIKLEDKLELDGIKLKLHHMPYSGDHTEKERYEKYRPIVEDEDVLLHGHIHSLWRTNRHSSGKLMINVGADVWNWTPVEWSIIKELICRKD